MANKCVFCPRTESPRWHTMGDFVQSVCGRCVAMWYRMKKEGMSRQEWVKNALKGKLIDRSKKGPSRTKVRSAEPRSASSTIKKNGRSVARNIALDKYPLDWCICKKCDLSEYEKKGDGEKRCSRCGTRKYGNGAMIREYEWKNRDGNPTCPACWQYNFENGHRRPLCTLVIRKMGLLRKREALLKKKEEMQKSVKNKDDTDSSDGSDVENDDGDDEEAERLEVEEVEKENGVIQVDFDIDDVRMEEHDEVIVPVLMIDTYEPVSAFEDVNLVMEAEAYGPVLELEAYDEVMDVGADNSVIAVQAEVMEDIRFEVDIGNGPNNHWIYEEDNVVEVEATVIVPTASGSSETEQETRCHRPTMGVEEVVEEELPVFEEQTEVARVVQMPMKWEEEWLEEDTEVGDDVICVLHLKNRLPIFVDDENFDYGFVTQEELDKAADKN